MIIKILQEISSQDGDIFSKIKKLMSLKKFKKNLDDGIKSKKIFHYMEQQNSSIENLFSKFDESDFRLFKKLFKEDVIAFLKKSKLKSNLNFQNRENSNQIGINTIFVEKPIMGLWTTGKSTFYLPTKPNQENEIVIEVQSVIPITIIIDFEGEKIHSRNIKKLSSERIKLKVPKTLVKDSISEICINTDKMWLPNVILGEKESIRIGIKIDSISINY